MLTPDTNPAKATESDKVYDLICELDGLFAIGSILDWELCSLRPDDQKFQVVREAIMGHHKAMARVFADLRQAAAL